ncbi:MAG: glycerol-3-phosphate 1-O-acyltransferase PlsY [Synechococcaceae cyanobacterium RL_1_2]|nr:glycerol-3-phosphate 1-O-acyltransferase PlsY [Synechococcaceae cyanobacterium RL_1_2]
MNYSSIAIAALVLLIAYLIGSIPPGYWAGQWLKGIDIREEGSGSTGATNVLRTVGKIPAIVVLLTDIGKGSLAVALVPLIYEGVIPLELPETWRYWLAIIVGLVAILGHSKSIFLNFSGGKSVATTFGVLLTLNYVVALSTLSVFLVCLAITRIVSFSSIVASLCISLFMFAMDQPLPYMILAAIAGFYVTIRHRANMQRLLAGTEPKLGQKVQES